MAALAFASTDSLFVEEDGDDDADDEDHGQHGAYHPDEAVGPRLHLPHVHVLRGQHRVRVRAGRKHFLERTQRQRQNSMAAMLFYQALKKTFFLYLQ